MSTAFRCALGALAFGFAVALAGSAAADERAPGSDDAHAAPLRLGVRGGASVPIGNAYAMSGPLSDALVAAGLLRVDAGYRITSHWAVGAQGTFGAIVPNACSANESCPGSDVRIGATLTFDLASAAPLDPWFGIGAGYEWLTWRRTLGERRIVFDAGGPEILELSAGVDLRPVPRLRVGPMLAASLGRFDWVAIDGIATRDFAAGAHAWLGVAIRASYDVRP